MVNSCRIEQLGVCQQIGRIDPSAYKARESAEEAPFRQSNPAAAFFGWRFQ